MKILTVVGARPNFMKIAPILSAISQHNEGEESSIRHVLVHTGQHYDQLMSDSFFTDLSLPNPDVHLEIGSGTHAAQTGEIMKRFEPVLLKEQPDVLLVVGDMNSTVACALVAAKISFDSTGKRPIIAHIEAGLRSFDRTMPEEINRIVTDQVSDLLFVTEESGLRNLLREGIPKEKVYFVGNTMIDSLLQCKQKADASTILDDLGLRKRVTDGTSSKASPYALLTLHRPSNVDHRDAFVNVLQGLDELANEYPIVFPAHPRTQKRIAELGIEEYFDWARMLHKNGGSDARSRLNAIRITEPLGYLDFLCLMSNAALVITDSGGIQEETTCLGVPCVTVRENTERPVTTQTGTNVLAGVTAEGIRGAIRRQLAARTKGAVPELWDGKASVRIIESIWRECHKEPLQPCGSLPMLDQQGPISANA